MKTTQPATRPLPRNAQPIPDSAFILCSCGNRGAVHSTGLCLDCMEAQPIPEPQPATRPRPLPRNAQPGPDVPLADQQRQSDALRSAATQKAHQMARGYAAMIGRELIDWQFGADRDGHYVHVFCAGYKKAATVYFK